MTTLDLGNRLNQIVLTARGILFRQSELAQLTYGAFDIAYRKVQADESETVELVYPVGWTAQRQPITATRKYSKQELLTQYQFLAINHVASNGIVHLVTIIEAMTNDLLRAIFAKYPQKLGSDRKIPIGVVLESTSIEGIHSQAIDALLNDFAYKSPTDYAEAIDKQTGINLRECTAFHRYVELKATRDVYIHNRGMANRTYVRKAGQHVRVPDGNFLPTDVQYFLESFEQCVQLTEWWEIELHDKWYSSEFEARKNVPQRADDEGIPPPVDAVSEELRALAAKYASVNVHGGKPEDDQV